ncbi:hypothetical protein FOL47_011074 [Perkinsus chesapeaki]|uniref:subtilisin n=1 Tax=Perkinsus chesapeaki TaxID=330153 RepID=A0A7J6L1C9_PERCH|nr:hypothetical protein FOL47_011074 [Perkinsus chesapeaki]
MNGHGTKLTSVIAAGINNGIGIAGITDKVKIRPIRLTAFPSGDTTEVETESAWKLASKFKDSDVIVMAFAGPFSKNASMMYRQVIKKAVKQGKFAVVSARNSDESTGPEEVYLPCLLASSMPGLVCVAATLASNPMVLESEASLLASFGAPGTDVMVAEIADGTGVWKYEEAGGSSAATAIVGGIAALMQSFKKFRPDVMKEILLNATVGKITFRDFSDAINYAVDSKVDLIILAASWKKHSVAVEASITKATQANIPLICTSGNHGKNISLPGETNYPCEYSKTSDGTICVAGTQNAGMKLHPKSNYAPFVDVAAPANVYSTTLSGGYNSFAGTSGSAAIVAGAIAMLKSVAPRPLSVKELKSIIKTTSSLGVKSSDGKTSMAFGRMDALKAIEMVIR